LPTNIDQLIQKISTTINDYVTTEDFANGFYGNKLESIIYGLDKSILSIKIKLVLVDELSSNNGNYKGNIGSKIKSDNCKLFSLMSKSYNQNGINYRIVSIGDSGVLKRQEYVSDGDSYSWNMDSNVGTIDPTTGEFDLNVDTNDLTVVTIPDTLDIDNNAGILVPVVFPPILSIDDIVIVDDISIEEEVVNPVVVDNTTPIDTVVINDIIPILSNIIC
jgi:hypothetical protein